MKIMHEIIMGALELIAAIVLTFMSSDKGKDK
jgi:hypothetical protein